MPDVALFTFILSIASRAKALKDSGYGKIAVDGTLTPNGYEMFLFGLCRRLTMNWIGDSLEGYFTAVRRAIYISLALRGVVGGTVLIWILRKLVLRTLNRKV
jgi:hypothetical protein